MELTQYQAVFMILLIFFVGDLVGALTKAKISSMFVIMMGFLVLFLTGIYPKHQFSSSAKRLSCAPLNLHTSHCFLPRCAPGCVLPSFQRLR